ncbi:MFS general substrate transporter [Trametes elegans]|nr:MFS general substrate transporter [Trametes elegans]
MSVSPLPSKSSTPELVLEDDSSSKHNVVLDSEAVDGSFHRTAAVNWYKLDIVILPVVTMMIFLSSLDRSNIGNAQIAGFQEFLHMSDSQFSMALTVTLIPYTVVDLPSNLLMKVVGPRILLPTSIILWGITATLQGVVHNYSGLLALRFFLGVFEGGCLPGLSLYLASFYPRRQLQTRVSIVFSATSIASAFSGLLAAAIIKMEGVGGRPGWAWLFILEGLFTIVFGLASYFMLPDNPAAVPALMPEEQKTITAILEADGLSRAERSDFSYTMAEVGRTFVQPHVILVALCGFFNGSALSGLSYFLPSIVEGLGWSGTKAQLMTVPPFAVSSVLSVVTSFISDRYSCRGLNTIFFALLAAIGFSIFLGSFVNEVRYGSLFLLVPGTFSIGPPLGVWAANNSSPFTRRATALAILPVTTNLGAILSTWLLGALSPPPRYTSATVTLLVFQLGIVACAGANVWWLARENARKRRARAALSGDEGDGAVPDPAGVKDESVWFTYVL